MNSRTYRLGLSALIVTLLLIAVGGFTRGSGSGYGCADRWPLCENGLLGGWLPRAEYHMIIEWSHRWLAATVGLLALATAVSAWRRHRDDRVIPLLATTAVVVIVIQAWIGRAVVKEQLDADLVSLHLAISLTAAALLAATVVTTRMAKGGGGADRAWVGILAGSAAGVFAVIMLGSLVHNLYFPGWPLMSGGLIPDLSSSATAIHFLHRLAAGLYALIAVFVWVAARSRGRPGHEVVLVGMAALAYATNILLGLGHVLTRVNSAALVALHLGVAAMVWILTVTAAVAAGRVGHVPAPDPARAETSV